MFHSRVIQLVAVLLVTLALARAAVAQENTGVSLRIEPEHVGLGGVVRPGSWTPMLLTVESHAATALKVRCEWVFNDPDRDEVHAQRVVTLSPQKEQQVWLYATPPLNYVATTRWTVKVIDATSETLLASQTVTPVTTISPRERAVGVATSLDLGLSAYAEPWTQHESCRFLRGLTPNMLPDRWYGLSMMQAYIWTPDALEGADPSSSKITPETRQAMFEWIRRGGHLVIVLPAVGDLWSSSPFRELLGGVQMETVTNYDIPVGSFLGSPSLTRTPVEVKVLQPDEASDVIFRSERTKGDVLGVARQFGLGRVTILGVDISDRRLTRMDLPNSMKTRESLVGESLWTTIFGWRGPVYTSNNIEGMRRMGELIAPESREYREIDTEIIRSQIAMRSTVSGAMLLAILLFLLYWFLAGPGSYAYLKHAGRVRHAWLAFAVVVLVFTAIAWGGALMLRQKRDKVAHFSMIDGDARSGLVHAHSWLSLFSPEQGRVEIAIDEANTDDNRKTLSAPGVSAAQDDSGFLDPQRYSFDSGAPNRASVPFRSTAKQFEVDFLMRGNSSDPAAEKWTMPQGVLRMKNGQPRGTLSHRLPGTLRDVCVIYNAHDGEEPLVWMWLAEWPAGKAVEFAPAAIKKRLAAAPPTDTADPGGFLGELMTTKTGANLGTLDTAAVSISHDLQVKLVQVLSLYSTMPAPKSRKEKEAFLTVNNVIAYWRTIGRPLDITALASLKTVIIIGFLDNSPLPVPLTVDGQTPEASGFTVVRWITRVEDDPTPATMPAATQPPVELITGDGAR